MHDTRKRERTFHVNMLKKWNMQTYGNYWTEAGEDWMLNGEEVVEVTPRLELSGDNCAVLECIFVR